VRESFWFQSFLFHHPVHEDAVFVQDFNIFMGFLFPPFYFPFSFPSLERSASSFLSYSKAFPLGEAVSSQMRKDQKEALINIPVSYRFPTLVNVTSVAHCYLLFGRRRCKTAKPPLFL